MNRGDEKKKDHGKAMWDLLPWRQVAKIVDVLTFGCEKYGPNQWQGVPDSKNRYFAALMRHLTSWWEGERYDPESGKHHLAHAGCCLLFLMWFDEEEKTTGEYIIKPCTVCKKETTHSIYKINPDEYMCTICTSIKKPEKDDGIYCNQCNEKTKQIPSKEPGLYECTICSCYNIK